MYAEEKDQEIEHRVVEEYTVQEYLDKLEVENQSMTPVPSATVTRLLTDSRLEQVFIDNSSIRPSNKQLAVAIAAAY